MLMHVCRQQRIKMLVTAGRWPTAGCWPPAGPAFGGGEVVILPVTANAKKDGHAYCRSV